MEFIPIAVNFTVDVEGIEGVDDHVVLIRSCCNHANGA